MSENTITIDYNPYLLKLKILNNGLENKTMFLDDFQNIQMKENSFCELLMRLIKRRKSLKILFIAHEQYHNFFNTAKEKTQEKIKKTIDVKFQMNTYSDEWYREKMQKITEDSLVENLDPEIKNTITRLQNGNLKSIPEDLRQLRLDVLKSDKFAENDENYIDQMNDQKECQQVVDEIKSEIKKLDQIQENASSKIPSIEKTVKTNSPAQIQTFIQYESARYEKLLNDLMQIAPKKYLPAPVTNIDDSTSTSNLKKIFRTFTNISYPSFLSKDEQKNLEDKINSLIKNYGDIYDSAYQLQCKKKKKQQDQEKKKDEIDNQIEVSKKLQEFRIKLLKLCAENE